MPESRESSPETDGPKQWTGVRRERSAERSAGAKGDPFDPPIQERWRVALTDGPRGGAEGVSRSVSRSVASKAEAKPLCPLGL